MGSVLTGPHDSKAILSAVTQVTEGYDDNCSAVGETLHKKLIMDRVSNAQLSGQGINFLSPAP